MDLNRLLGYVLRAIARYLLAGYTLDHALRLTAERIDPTPGKGTPERVAWENAERTQLAAEATLAEGKPTDTPDADKLDEPVA